MEYVDVARYVFALILVLSLLGLAGVAARRYGVPGVVKASAVRRLSVSESMMIGPRQKLLLVRRDDREHLLFIGPQGAILIENSVAAPETSAK
jgi:flagellar protein FliO/FliZ